MIRILIASVDVYCTINELMKNSELNIMLMDPLSMRLIDTKISRICVFVLVKKILFIIALNLIFFIDDAFNINYFPIRLHL